MYYIDIIKNMEAIILNLVKKILTVAMCGMIAASAVALVPQTSLETNAAKFSDVNASSVFVKQQKSDTCTLASNVMLLRRTAMMRGDSDWSSITESACRPTMWVEDVGMYHNYTYKGITVSYQYSISGSVTTALINALKEHPEGIVVYDYDYPHAILLTDYTDGVFYCADPANNVPSGRIPVSKSLISISNVDTYWYVTSPDVSFGGSSNGSNNNNNNSSTVNEKWKITSDVGVNMRSGAGTSYSIVGAVPYNATVTVTKKTSSGGYTWGYTTYGGATGWIALDYATKVSSTSTALANNSTISKTTVTQGNQITVNLSASGGTAPYKYAVTARLSGASDWSVVRTYSTNSTVNWSPAKTGTYQVCAKVRDSKGEEVKKFFTLTVNENKNAPINNSTISKTTINKGSSITLKGSATGGKAPYQYAFTVKHSSATSWTVLKDYNTTATKTWTPSKTGTYQVCAKVKASNGVEVKKFFDLTVK